LSEDKTHPGWRIGEVAARAFVEQGDVRAGPFSVLGFSDCAVLLAGVIPFGIGEPCRVLLDVQGHPSHSLHAELVRVERSGGAHRFEMEFRDVSDEIRARLLGLVRAGTPGASDSVAWQERRRFPRARVTGTAIALVRGRYVGAYVVRNLSAGGAHLVGDNNLAIGQVVQILLRVGGEFSHSIDAEVVRREQLPSNEQSFAVAFKGLAPDVENALQNLAVITLETAVAEKATAVLVLKSPSAVLLALEGDLRSLGHEVVVVATPLDALSQLCSHAHRIVAAIVECDLVHADPLGFLSFLKDAYPRIRRVALPGDSRPKQLERVIAAGAVEAVLNSPWNSESLAKALRRP
jgi:CheY-like chemotaxis protein